MARVPVYEGLTQTLAPQRANFQSTASPDAFGASIARGAGALAQGVDRASDALQLLQDKEDEAIVKERVNALQDWRRDALYNPENGFLNTQGQDAVNRRGEFEQSVFDSRSNIGNGLTGRQRELFDGAADQLEDQTLNATIQHTSQQRKVWINDASAARIQTFADDAVVAFADDRMVAQSIAGGGREIMEQAALNGWDDATTQRKLEEYQSAVLKNVILRRTQDDPLAAQRYFEANRDRLTGQNAYELEVAMESEVLKARTVQEADRILSNTRLFEGASVPVATTAAGTTGTSTPTAADPTPVARSAPRAYGPRVTLKESGDQGTYAFLQNRLVNRGRLEDIDGLQANFAQNLAAMFEDAPPEMAKDLGILSGYRSIARQQALWDASDKTGRMVGRPGGSKHNHGQAVDISYKGRSLRHAPQNVIDWVHRNAKNYGIWFPMSYENWHAEPFGSREQYVGGGAAPRAADAPQLGGNAGAVAGVPANSTSTVDPVAATEQQLASSSVPAQTPDVVMNDGSPAPQLSGDEAMQVIEAAVAGLSNDTPASNAPSQSVSVPANSGMAVQRTTGLVPRAMHPSYATIEGELAKIEDVELRDATRTRLNTLMATQTSQAEAAQKAAQAQLWSIIDSGGTPDDASPELRAAAGMSAVSSSWSFVEARTKRGTVEPENDETLLYELRRMSVADPAGFADINLLDYRPQLDSTALKELTDKQTSILDPNATANKPDELKLSQAWALGEDTLAGLGITTVGQKGTKLQTARAQISAFNNALTRLMQEQFAATQKQPTDVEIMGMIRQLTLPVILTDSGGGWFGRDSTREAFLFEVGTRKDTETVDVNVAYEQVPVEARTKIVQSLTARLGREPTKDEVTDLYERYVLASANSE